MELFLYAGNIFYMLTLFFLSMFLSLTYYTFKPLNMATKKYLCHNASQYMSIVILLMKS